MVRHFSLSLCHCVTVQSLGPWLREEAQRYAQEGGVHNQPRDRLLLKCERAATLFLRLELNGLSLEDSIILCNIIESAGVRFFTICTVLVMQRAPCVEVTDVCSGFFVCSRTSSLVTECVSPVTVCTRSSSLSASLLTPCHCMCVPLSLYAGNGVTGRGHAGACSEGYGPYQCRTRLPGNAGMHLACIECLLLY